MNVTAPTERETADALKALGFSDAMIKDWRRFRKQYPTIEEERLTREMNDRIQKGNCRARGLLR